jgi:hypothetical protein
MKRKRVRRRPLAAEAPPGAVSAAEEAARTAPAKALTDEEKAHLAAEVSRIEDA